MAKKIRGNTEQQSNSLVATTYCFLSSALPYIFKFINHIDHGYIYCNYLYKTKTFFLTAFFENLKILIVSAALPTILSVLIQLFVPNFDGTTFILFAALFLFTQGVKGSPKIQLKS